MGLKVGAQFLHRPPAGLEFLRQLPADAGPPLRSTVLNQLPAASRCGGALVEDRRPRFFGDALQAGLASFVRQETLVHSVREATHHQSGHEGSGAR